MLALLATGCQDDLIQKVDLPEGAVFTATTEDALTKTALAKDGDTYQVLWQSGDRIIVVDGSVTPNVGVYSTTDSGTNADFTFSSGSAASEPDFKAYYPADIYNDGTPALPAVQTYTANNITGSPMYAESSGSSLAFKNLCGIIRLNLTTTQNNIRVKSVRLVADQPMSGSFSISDNAAVIISGNDVKLDCGDGVAIGNSPTPFHIAVPARVAGYTNLKIIVTTTEGGWQTRTANKEIKVFRSKLTDITLSFDNLASSPVDLSAKETANTYLVSSPGTYKFKATVKGNGGLDPVTGTKATTINSASISGVTVLWELAECGKAIRFSDGEYNISYANGYVFFRTPETFVPGDAYVAVYHDGDGGRAGEYDKGIDEILWSWLIWTTPVPAPLEYNGGLFMDRNIGAFGTGGTYAGGFAYQWGRPAPFSASYNQNYTPYPYYPERTQAFSFENIGDGTTVAHAVSHPATFFYHGSRSNWMTDAATCLTLWSDDTKTIYDPSPIGWKVPSKTQLDGITGTLSFYGTGFIGPACSSDFEYGNPGSVLLWSSTCDNDGGYLGAWANAYGSMTKKYGSWPDVYLMAGLPIRPVEDLTSLKDLAEYTDLSAVAAANSYVVPAVGDYKFRADVKGNGASNLAGVNKNTDLSSIKSAELLWASYGTDTAPTANSLIRKVGYQDGYVYFSTGINYKEGNAVVAIKDESGNILWSWHLWLTDDDLESSAQTYAGGAVFMDRNLGALSADSAPSNFGLLYQWGRKDPFLNAKSTISGDVQNYSWQPAVAGTQQSIENTGTTTSYTVAQTVNKPNTFIFSNISIKQDRTTEGGLWASDITENLWASEKTIFDPCPPGWKVPETGHWDNAFRDDFFSRPNANPLLVKLPSSTASFTGGGMKTTTSVYRYHYNGGNPITEYYVRNAGWVAVPNGYHFRLWACNGALLRDSFSGYEDPNPGVFSYSEIAGRAETLQVDLTDMFWDNYAYQIGHKEGVIYQKAVLGSGISVRCVRETSQIVPATSVSLPATASVSQFSSIQLTVTSSPAQAGYYERTWSSSDETVAKVDSRGKVLGIAQGNCEITVTTSFGSASCSVTVTAPSSTMEAVDMGLPSGTKWANLNWGADSQDMNGSYNTRYEAQNALDGTAWRLPTKDECDELVNNCTISVISSGSIKGLIVTSLRNGQSIFFPASGYKKSKYGNKEFEGSYPAGHYWCSDYYPSTYKYYTLEVSTYNTGSIYTSSGIVESSYYTTFRPVK